MLHFQRQLLDPRPGLPQLRFQPGGGGGSRLAALRQLIHAADSMLRQEVAGLGDAFQILDGRPMAVARALLGLDVVLNIYKQADFSALLLRLAGGSGASGHPCGQGVLGVIRAQGL